MMFKMMKIISLLESNNFLNFIGNSQVELKYKMNHLKLKRFSFKNLLFAILSLPTLNNI